MNGTEGMLRAMGLAPVLDAANKIAASGAVEKLLRFAEQADEINATLKDLRTELAALRAARGSGSAHAGLDDASSVGNSIGVASNGVHVGAGSHGGSNSTASDCDAGPTIEGEFSVRQTG